MVTVFVSVMASVKKEAAALKSSPSSYRSHGPESQLQPQSQSQSQKKLTGAETATERFDQEEDKQGDWRCSLQL